MADPLADVYFFSEILDINIFRSRDPDTEYHMRTTYGRFSQEPYRCSDHFLLSDHFPPVPGLSTNNIGGDDDISKHLIGASPSCDGSNDLKSVFIPEIVKKGLRFAPAEVRLRIFSYVFDDAKAHFPLRPWEVPSLILALKGEKELYKEAVEAYFKSATFYANWSYNEKGSMSSIDMIRKLRIKCTEQIFPGDEIDKPYIDGNFSDYRYPLALPSDGPSSKIKEILFKANNVTDLSLFFDRGCVSNGFIERSGVESAESFLTKAVRCIRSFPKLKDVAIGMMHDNVVDEPAYRSSTWEEDGEEECLVELEVIRRLGVGFGSTAKIAYEGGDWYGPICIGLWQAKHGELLELKNEMEEEWFLADEA